MHHLKIPLIGLLLGMCVGCAPSLRPTPATPQSLAGNWVADAARCQAIETQLHAALDAARDKELSNATRRGKRPVPAADQAQASADTTPHMGPYSWEVREQREEYQALFDVVRPVMNLDIVQEHGQIIFNSSHEAQRNFEPGTSSTLVTTFADLHIESGWQNEEFVVHSKDSREGVEIYERYHHQQNGSLLLSVTLSVKYMDTQQYTLVYHRHRPA